MGRTLLPFRPALDMEIASWIMYRKGLRPEDRPYFDKVCQFARQHGDAGSLAARLILSDNIWMSALIEQQKQLELYRQELEIMKIEIKKNS